jgi:hypothetical protein
MPRLDCSRVSFWGQILNLEKPLLRGAALINSPNQNKITPVKTFFLSKSGISVLDKVTRDSSFVSGYYLKPPLSLAFNTEKQPLFYKLNPVLFSSRKREPMIIFHPLLPHDFTLYFKDRQVAHVELMFNIVSTGKRNSITMKRKISSGNLEVDLLSMRYIGRYLFIQQARFTPNNWQSVKIDLSAKND